jgi:hypothetical protein
MFRAPTTIAPRNQQRPGQQKPAAQVITASALQTPASASNAMRAITFSRISVHP